MPFYNAILNTKFYIHANSLTKTNSSARRNVFSRKLTQDELFSILKSEHILRVLTGRAGPTSWSPCSPGFTPLDFFFWGYIEDRIFATPVAKGKELKIRLQFARINVYFATLLYQTVGNLTLNLISRDSSNFSKLYKFLFILFSYWSIPSLLLLTLGSAEKLYIRAEFAIFLCTKDGMSDATETSACNLSNFYWCSKPCSFSCYLQRQVLTDFVPALHIN